MKKLNWFLVFNCLLFLSCSPKSIPKLDREFANPPAIFQPRTWMHAMNGNMSKAGFTKDLEAMADVGIGGIILFNVSAGTPVGKVKFNSPEHIALTAHAAAECERLGLSFGIHNCDGWTSSGGPWVTPEHSMKQITHREIVVDGGDVNVLIPQPTARGDFYKDLSVLAYPALESEVADWNNKPLVSSSDPKFDCALATNGNIDKRTELNAPKDSLAWVQFDFGKPYTLRSFYLNSEKNREDGLTVIQSSDDGIHFEDVVELKVIRQGKREYGIDSHFEGIRARYFRFVTDMYFDISEINFSATYRYDNLLARTNLFKLENRRMPAMDEAPSNMVIQKKEIIDLSSKMNENGQLIATLPEGKWTIMRFGYTITGAVNGPASDEGRGWEVDKMSRESFKTFYEGYVRNVIDAAKKVAPNALQYIEIDSYEVGGQNWTTGYEDLFKKEHGYDILEYLPLYAGRYIADTETTERILWDTRNFNSKLMTDNYFDYFSELCHEDGLISYVEPYSFNAGFNELDATRKVDITMGEFWMHQRYQAGTAVSGARIYGKNIVSAESFSAQPVINWKGHPGTLKLTGDKAWTLGINEFFFHRFAHQANTHVVPGMTMHQWGSHIDRTQTWWDNAGKAWFKYLARGQYILRQGVPVSDLLVFVGDGSPNSIHNRNFFKEKLPNHINFDCINSDALINRISTKNGKLYLPNGIQYSALHLTNTKEFHLSTLKKIAELAEQGVLIVGNKPETLGGFNRSVSNKIEFKSLVNSIWSKPTTYQGGEWDSLFSKHGIPTDLKIENGKDINYTHRKTANEDIYFFYNPDSMARTYDCTFNVDGRIPELWNQMTGETTKLAAFEHKNGQTRVAISLTGEGSTFVVFRNSSKGIQTVSPDYALKHEHVRFSLDATNKLQIESPNAETLDIAFTDGIATRKTFAKVPNDLPLSESWKVEFPNIKSGGKTIEMLELTDWTMFDDEEIKHYSGTAIYTSTVNITSEMLAENVLCKLDLGVVNVAASVRINDQELGIAWMKPHVLDITSSLKIGENTVQIEVTNQWTNRLIGDEKLPNETGFSRTLEVMPEWFTNNEPAPQKQRSTFTIYDFYDKDSELLPAGLTGPVQITFSKLDR
jgi:hypothetical protein